MNKALRTVGIFFAALLSILFATASLLALTVYNLEKNLFDADVYIAALNDAGIYERLPEIAAEAMAESAQTEGSSIAALQSLPQDSWESIVRSIFPADLLKSMTDNTLIQIVAYANGESERAVLSLAELKAYMLSPTGVDAVYQLLQAQPDCTLEQLTSMATGASGLILCKPPEQFLGFDLRPIYEAEIRGVITLIPEEVPLITRGHETNKAIDELSRLRTLSRLTPVIPLAILLLITLIAVRSFKDWLIWWGIPLVLISIPAMLTSLGASVIFSRYFEANIAKDMAENFPPSIVTAIQDVTGAIVEQALRPMLMQAFVIGAVGGLMLLVAFLINEARRKKG